MTINFDAFLFLAFIACFIIYLIDKFIFEKRRVSSAQVELDKKTIDQKQFDAAIKPPLLANLGRSLWSVFLIVFIIRAIFLGNYHVPTGSLLPTIQIGDYLLVNKLSYEVRVPLTNIVLWKYSSPKRGDIVVFRYPPNPNIDYIKTVIGLPGDHISMQDKQLYINGKKVPTKYIRSFIEPADSAMVPVKEYQENLDGHKHDILIQPWTTPTNFKNLVVPKGEYFMMGDNRDNSADSRYWGFVPAKDILGKAFVVWFSWNSRTHSVRWDRLGKLLP